MALYLEALAGSTAERPAAIAFVKACERYQEKLAFISNLDEEDEGMQKLQDLAYNEWRTNHPLKKYNRKIRVSMDDVFSISTMIVQL